MPRLAAIRAAGARNLSDLSLVVDRIQDHHAATLNPALAQVQQLAKPCAARAKGATTLGTSGSLSVTTSAQAIVFTSVDFDTDNAFGTRSAFVVPSAKGGTYMLGCGVQFSGSTAAGMFLQIYVGTTAVMTIRGPMDTTNTHYSLTASGALALLGGQSVSAQVVATAGGNSLLANTDSVFFSLVRIPGL